MAGFSEHDTFRSNKIREGYITVKKALELVQIEGKLRFEYIKWFLQILDLDYKDKINIINSKKIKILIIAHQFLLKCINSNY